MSQRPEAGTGFVHVSCLCIYLFVHISYLCASVFGKRSFLIKLCRITSVNKLLMKVPAEIAASTGEDALLSRSPGFSTTAKQDLSVLAVTV